MNRIQRLTLALGAPAILAGVLGGAIVFAQEGGSATPTPSQESTPAPTDEASPAPSDEATPDTPKQRDGRDCPEKDGNGGGSESESESSTAADQI